MNQNKNTRLHVYVSGNDCPGILADVIEQTVLYGWSVMDIKQFVFNGLLNLSLLLEGGDQVGPLKLVLNEYSLRSNLIIDIHPWDMSRELNASYKFRYVVTLLGRRINSMTFLDFARTIAKKEINILRIEQLDYIDYHVLEFVLGCKYSTSGGDLLKQLVRFKESQDLDIAIQEDTLFRRNKRLIVLDADMTFLQCEVIDELGKLAGKGEEMQSITLKAMNNEISFSKALHQRVALLKGLPESCLYELLPKIPMTPGAEGLVKILKHLGYRIAIVSGGFQFFVDNFKEKYKLDYGYANKLKIVNGVLTGELEGDIIDARAKEQILVSLAEREGFSLKQIVAVGDGANDIYMLAAAGLGIAFNAKPIVQKQAQASINISNLELILYFLGISGKDLKELRQITREQSFDQVSLN